MHDSIARRTKMCTRRPRGLINGSLLFAKKQLIFESMMMYQLLYNLINMSSSYAFWFVSCLNKLKETKTSSADLSVSKGCKKMASIFQFNYVYNS